MGLRIENGKTSGVPTALSVLRRLPVSTGKRPGLRGETALAGVSPAIGSLVGTGAGPGPPAESASA